MSRSYLVAASTLALTVTSGCDMSRFAANQTADLFARGSVAFDRHWDYDFAGRAAPASVMQIEALLAVSPENETLLLEAAKGYASYAYGWVEDDLEAAEDAGDLERADRLRTRAKLLYLRARDLGKRLLRERDDGLDAALASGVEGLERWLRETFDDRDDAPALLWTGYAWGAAINMALDDPELIADVAFARALVQRSVELDPAYFHALGLTFLGFADAGFPPALGGDPESGRRHFERALELTGRRAFLVHVNFAKSYAVSVQDRELYVRLLEEVLEGGDVDADVRLANKIARRRAQRYLTQLPRLF